MDVSNNIVTQHYQLGDYVVKENKKRKSNTYWQEFKRNVMEKKTD